MLKQRGLGHSCTIVPSMMKFIFGGATELTSARLALPCTSKNSIPPQSPPLSSASPVSRPKAQRTMSNPLVGTVVKGARRLSTRLGSSSQISRINNEKTIQEEPSAKSSTTTPPGLVLLPDILLPMPRRELDIHVSRATHILLGSKHEIWRAQGESDSKPTLSREEFDEDIWHYETWVICSI